MSLKVRFVMARDPDRGAVGKARVSTGFTRHVPGRVAGMAKGGMDLYDIKVLFKLCFVA